MTYHLEEFISEQVPEEHGFILNGEQVNNPIEEDDHTNNVVEDDNTKTLIHDSFNVRMDYDDDDDHENIDDFDDVLNIPLLEKACKPLYEGSKIDILSAILLILNLKVMNGIQTYQSHGC